MISRRPAQARGRLPARRPRRFRATGIHKSKDSMRSISKILTATMMLAGFPLACGGDDGDAYEPPLGEMRSELNSGFFSDPLITAPTDAMSPDGKVSVCVNASWASNCDYQIAGQPGSILIPLGGSITIEKQSVTFAEDRINDLRVSGGGGYISVALTNAGPGCNLDLESGTLRVDMIKFWKSVTLSPDKKTLSWDMTGSGVATFDAGGCSQVQAPIDLTMLLRLPVIQSNGKYDNKFVTISTVPGSGQSSSSRYPLPPITMTNDAPKPSSLDFVFVIDTTGSMWDDIGAVKSSSVELVDTLFNDIPDPRIAVIDYKDFPQVPYGGSGDYPHRLFLDFSSNRDQVVSAIQSLTVGGGGDTPEAVYSGLMAAFERPQDHLGQALGAWRSGAKKTVLLLGDAPPHDPEPVTGYTLQIVQDAAAAVGGTPELPDVSANFAALLGGSADATSGGVSIYTLQIGYDSTTKSFFEALSAGTGGQSFTAVSASGVVPAIREIIGVIGGEPAPGNRSPETRWATASVDRLFPPNKQMIAINILGVSDPDGDPVTIEISKITQDEPPGDPGVPDATGVGAAHATLRATRAGNGNGRVYRLEFVARDLVGTASTGAVMVCVPHDQGENAVCEDDGQAYDAAVP